MQTTGEGLFTFLPQSLPFLYQPGGGLTGTVVIQSSVPPAAAPVQLPVVQQQRFVLLMVIIVAAVCCDAHRTELPTATPQKIKPT